MSQPESNRREFLRGNAAARSLRRAVDAAIGDEEKLAAAASLGPVLTLTRRAMACEFEVRLNVSQEENDTEHALAALDLIETIEDQLTVYRDTSEVIEINLNAANGPVTVEPQLFHLLTLAEQLYRDSSGAFDITSGPLSQAWGFSKREGRLPSEPEIETALAQVGWQHVLLDKATQTIAFDQPGIEINLNSLGKGYALDQAADLLQLNLVEDFLLHGGRSTLLAKGMRSGSDSWGVGIRHPLRPQQRLAEIQLFDQAFSTSGSATQCFIHQGKRYGHLIDPRTGWPAGGLHSVSVVAPTGADADALSTAFYVMGREASQAYLANHPEVGALFVEPASRSGQVEVIAVNLAADRWKPQG